MSTSEWDKLHPRVQAAVPIPLNEKFSAYAADQGLNRSQALNKILDERLRNYGESDPEEAEQPNQPIPGCGLVDSMEARMADFAERQEEILARMSEQMSVMTQAMARQPEAMSMQLEQIEQSIQAWAHISIQQHELNQRLDQIPSQISGIERHETQTESDSKLITQVMNEVSLLRTEVKSAITHVQSDRWSLPHQVDQIVIDLPNCHSKSINSRNAPKQDLEQDLFSNTGTYAKAAFLRLGDNTLQMKHVQIRLSHQQPIEQDLQPSILGVVRANSVVFSRLQSSFVGRKIENSLAHLYENVWVIISVAGIVHQSQLRRDFSRVSEMNRQLSLLEADLSHSQFLPSSTSSPNQEIINLSPKAKDQVNPLAMEILPAEATPPTSARYMEDEI